MHVLLSETQALIRRVVRSETDNYIRHELTVDREVGAFHLSPHLSKLGLDPSSREERARLSSEVVMDLYMEDLFDPRAELIPDEVVHYDHSGHWTWVGDEDLPVGEWLLPAWCYDQEWPSVSLGHALDLMLGDDYTRGVATVSDRELWPEGVSRYDTQQVWLNHSFTSDMYARDVTGEYAFRVLGVSREGCAYFAHFTLYSTL